MAKIQFKGWKAGFLKVSCTKLFQEIFELSLSESKDLTDRILDRHTFSLEISPDKNPNDIIERFTSIGVECSIVLGV